MKGELKAGGLALVIKSTDTEDVGKCVTLVQFVKVHEDFTAPDGRQCRNSNPHAGWVVTGDVITSTKGIFRFHGWALFPPENLLPLDGDDNQERDQLAKDKPAVLTA